MAENISKQIILTGVGGQGTVLASKLLAQAAMNRGLSVMSAETIGMAQRGGSVFSHLRIGGEIKTPMIALHSADLIIGFEPGETVRMLPYLKEDGAVVTAKKGVMPVTASLKPGSYDPEEMLSYLEGRKLTLVAVDAEEICHRLGSAKVLNMVLLGAALKAGLLPFTAEELIEALAARLPEKLMPMNKAALLW